MARPRKIAEDWPAMPERQKRRGARRAAPKAAPEIEEWPEPPTPQVPARAETQKPAKRETGYPHTFPAPAPSIYTPQIAYNIIYIYANTNRSITDICDEYHISHDAWYDWLASNRSIPDPQLLPDGIDLSSIDISDPMYSAILITLSDLYSRARAHRSHVLFDGISVEQASLAKEIELEPDTRRADIKIRLSTLAQKRTEFLITKGNPSVYGDRVQVDQRVTVDPGDIRAQAWDQRKRIMATYRVDGQQVLPSKAE